MMGTPWDNGGDGAVSSVNGQIGDVVLTAGDVGGLVGDLGGTDNALLRADGSGGQTAQASGATLDDAANLVLGSRAFHQPFTPSPWSGASSSHEFTLPTWATATGKYCALIRVRVQQNAATSSFQARTHQMELSFNGTSWSIDANALGPAIGALNPVVGWQVTGAGLRLNLSGLGAGDSGNVGVVFEQFFTYGAL